MPARSALLRPLAFSMVTLTAAIAVADLEQLPLDTPQFRRPVAIAQLDDSTLIVANRCGSLSVIDVEKWMVVSEFQVGTRLTDVTVAKDLVLVTDSEESRLSVLRVSRQNAKLVSELDVPTHPMTVQVTSDETSCSVASKWARKLTFVTLKEEPAIVETIDLTFCPGEQLNIPSESALLVADAFNGRLAVINPKTRDVESVHDIGAHNIRGLAVSDDLETLFVSHQILNDRALPRRSDIIWGVMIDNFVRAAKLDGFLEGRPNAIYSGRTISVGYAGNGAGDPDTMFVDQNGQIVVALAGVDEVTFGEPDSRSFRRVRVGRRPTDLLPLAKGRFVVLNELSDSLTLIDTNYLAESSPVKNTKNTSASNTPVAKTASYERSKKNYDEDYRKKYGDNENSKYDYDQPTGTYGGDYTDNDDIYMAHLSLGPSPQAGPVERGEQLFFSARLSHASWFSCHSCHTDGHTNSGRSDTFGDDTQGAPKRVLSLLGVGETKPWGWNGKKPTLPKQIHQSASSTMRGRGVSPQAAADLAAFLSSLQPPPAYEPPVTPSDHKIVNAGRQLFESLNCNSCHSGKTLTSDDVYDVGLEDERGLRLFNPPTLRGVGYRENLFHDKRAVGLEEVFTKYAHELERELSEAELSVLVRYLRSL